VKRLPATLILLMESPAHKGRRLCLPIFLLWSVGLVAAGLCIPCWPILWLALRKCVHKTMPPGLVASALGDVARSVTGLRVEYATARGQRFEISFC